MKKLGEEMRTGQLKQVYLLCGEEAYLRRQYRDRVKKALMGDGDLMNLNCFEGKELIRAKSLIWRRPCRFWHSGACLS